jgi:hypothetical protein
VLVGNRHYYSAACIWMARETLRGGMKSERLENLAMKEICWALNAGYAQENGGSPPVSEISMGDVLSREAMENVARKIYAQIDRLSSSASASKANAAMELYRKFVGSMREHSIAMGKYINRDDVAPMYTSLSATLLGLFKRIGTASRAALKLTDEQAAVQEKLIADMVNEFVDTCVSMAAPVNGLLGEEAINRDKIVKELSDEEESESKNKIEGETEA